MFKTLGSALKNREIRKSIIITLLLLLVYRLGCYLPTPGLNREVFWSNINNDSTEGILSLLNAVTGNALEQAAIFALGVTPYINASIIVQLLAVAIPPLERLSKEGDEGREKINLITKIVALVLALAQGLGIVLGLSSSSSNYISPIFGENLTWLTSVVIITVLMAGTCFTIWLGDKITEQGVGNGLSLIIFVGIIATAAESMFESIKNIFANQNLTMLWELIGFVALVVVIFFLIVFVDMSERRINVQYAKQIKGRKMYGGQSSYIPMKVNASGVMPIIFASAIITFPSLVMALFGVTKDSGGFAAFWYEHLAAGSVLYSILTALLILFFAYFYASIQFNPSDISLNIQQHGGFIPGIRQGKPTTEYLRKISRRITLFGAIFLAFIALVPSVIFSAVANGQQSLLNSFTATGMLIVVSVAIEFQDQLEAQLMMRRHKNIL